MVNNPKTGRQNFNTFTKQDCYYLLRFKMFTMKKNLYSHNSTFKYQDIIQAYKTLKWGFVSCLILFTLSKELIYSNMKKTDRSSLVCKTLTQFEYMTLTRRILYLDTEFLRGGKGRKICVNNGKLISSDFVIAFRTHAEYERKICLELSFIFSRYPPPPSSSQ